MSSKKTAVTEAQILTSFLLSRSTLKDIIGFREFAELFPREKRSHPQVKHLYRVLHSLRQRQCEQVRRKIHSEAATSIKHVKEGRNGEADEADETPLELEAWFSSSRGGENSKTWTAGGVLSKTGLRVSVQGSAEVFFCSRIL